jgi:hypothetical protein
MKNILFLFSVVILLLFGCKKEDEKVVPTIPVIEDTTVVNEPDTLSQYNWTSVKAAPTTQRNLVIEEFTGAMCKFCPIGHRELERLDSIYGGQVIPVSIHAGGFARFQSDSSKKFFLDLNIPIEAGETESKGEVYLNTFNPNLSYPRGIVSRITPEAENQSKWQGAIDGTKNDPMKATMDLEVKYAQQEDLIHLLIDYTFSDTSSSNYTLQVYIIENDIIGWQNDRNVFLEFYQHNYVLRKVLNGTWGESLSSLNLNEKYRKEYVFKKAPHWNQNNVKVVAFLTIRDTKEIIQATQASLK